MFVDQRWLKWLSCGAVCIALASPVRAPAQIEDQTQLTTDAGLRERRSDEVNPIETGPVADKPAGTNRRRESQEFHFRAQQRTGLLVPLYVYPANIHKNPDYNRLIDLKRRFETVPIWVIVNPASGPGKEIDPNYQHAIDRLCGAGCVTLGYVTTSYAKRPSADVCQEIRRWREFYPRVHGIFLDEMTNEDTDQAATFQTTVNRCAQDAGFWPTVGNPGTDTPTRYFTSQAADVIVVHEGDSWPTEKRLHGDYFGGYADFPPFTRGILVHSQRTLDRAAVQMVRRYVRWIYVTDDEYRVNDPQADNPWDRVSQHLEELCELLRDEE